MQRAVTLFQSRRNAPWVLLLCVLGVFSRLPFVSQVLYHWDSINYTLALKEFSLTLNQPQPPGYILYVLLTRAVYALVGNPNWTFVGVNIAVSTLAAVALYYVGCALFSRSVGVVSSFYLLFGPLFWFYSEIALPNVIDALVTTLIAYYFYQVSRGKKQYIFPAATLLGIAGGFRQQTLVFMAPLAVWAMRKTRLSQMVLAGGWTSVLFLASFVPMVQLSGGWIAYRQAVNGLSDSFFTKTSIFLGGGWAGLVGNVAKWVAFTAYSLNLAAVPLGLWCLWKIRSAPAVVRDERTWLLAIWIAPSLAFYTFIHMGGHGLIFTFLPAVILVAAKALGDLTTRLGKRSQAGLVAALGILMLVDGVLFIGVSNRPLGSGSDFKIVNWPTIQANDRFFQARFAQTRANFDPARTVILADTWRHAQYYLPTYYVIGGVCGTPTATVAVHGGTYQPIAQGQLERYLPSVPDTVVVFDDTALCLLASLPADRLKSRTDVGETLYYVQLQPGETLNFTAGQLVVGHK